MTTLNELRAEYQALDRQLEQQKQLTHNCAVQKDLYRRKVEKLKSENERLTKTLNDVAEEIMTILEALEEKL